MKLILVLVMAGHLALQPSFQTEPVSESATAVVPTATTKKPNDNSLGFLVKRKRVKLPSVTKRQLIKLSANLGFNESEATEELQKATVEVEKLKTIQALKETGDVPTYLARHINSIVKEFTTFKKEVALLLGYKDEEKQPSKDLACSQTLPGINAAFLQALTADLKTNIGFVQTTKTVSQLLSEEDSFYENMILTLFRLKEIVGNARTLVKNYVILLDNLTSYKLSDINLWYMQMVTCVEDFLIEKYTVKECNKVKTGVECIIGLKVFKSMKDLTLYTPISYNGYELFLNEGEYAVKDENQHWGKLKCKENILEQGRDDLLDSDICQFEETDSQCFKNIEGSDFNKIKQQCTFTEKRPEPVIETDEGLLVQSKEVNLKEVDQSKRSNPIIHREVPYLIRSDKTLSVHTKDTEDLYEPVFDQISKQIITTFLSEIQRKSLTTIQAMRNWNWTDAKEAYIAIIGSICGLILVLVLIILFKCKQENLQRYLARNAENQSDTQRRQQNYRLNRLILKN